MTKDPVSLEAPFEVVLLGAGWHAREVACYITDLAAAGKGVRLAGLVDEGKPAGPWGESRILGNFGALSRFAETARTPLRYITATGSNAFRRRFVEELEKLRLPIPPWTLVHPTAYVGSGNAIGEGACLAPAVVVTAGARVGRHCILNARVSIHHDCVVGDFVNLNPGVTVCGNVQIGDDCFIGAGATVIDKVAIGAGTIVGAGAVVTRDLPPNVTAVGVPARVIKTHGR